jgi:hypothetical protein
MSSASPIPIEILNQHLVALGKTGSGKSSAMRTLVEMLLDAGKRVCIIDKKGDWYGIKLSADGKSAGYPIMAFGDFKNPDATDLHITENHGNEIGKLIASGNRPCVIGFRGWMPGRMHKFWIDFASTLYNENKSPLWLLIDEAHNFSPKGKVLSPQVGECIYWTNLIASEGRGIGLRLIVSSQRPAKVHNDLLTSCETLIAMRVTHPSDREAFAEWLKEYSNDNARGKLILDSMSKIKTGEAFIWSPEAELFKQVKFPMFKTFDSFASPKEGKQRSLKGWASVNLDEVKEKLSKVIEETKENDPKELKKIINKLQIDLNNAIKTTPKISPLHIDQTAIDKAIKQAINKIQSQYESQIEKAKKEIDIICRALSRDNADMFVLAKALQEVKLPDAINKIRRLDLFKAEARKELVKPIVGVKVEIPKNVVTVRPNSYSEHDYDRDRLTIIQEIKLDAGARRMLALAVQFSEKGLTRSQVKTMGGVKAIQTFYTYSKKLRSQGLWEERGGLFFPTQAGITLIGKNNIDTPSNTDEVLNMWMNHFDAGARRILVYLKDRPGQWIDRDEIMRECEIKAIQTLYTYQKKLKTANLILVQGNQLTVNKETLFL